MTSSKMVVALDARMPAKPSGVGVYTRELLAGLAAVQAAENVRLLAVCAPGQVLPANVDRVETSIPFDAHGPAELFEHLELPRILAKLGVQVFHGPNTIIPVGKVPFARVVTIHDVAFQRHGETLPPAFRLLMRVRTATSLAVCDAALAVSRFTADELRLLHPEHAHKVTAVTSGTPSSAVDHVVSAHRARVLLNGLGLVPRRYVCAIGTLEPRKNLVTLLKAFQQAAIPDFKLALVGDQGWRDGPLKEALQHMPPHDVVLTGWIEDEAMRDLVSQSAALLYPSIYEGFGFPPLEALALGVPAVTAMLPPVQESCGRLATMVPALDVGAWAKAMEDASHAKARKPWVGRTFVDVARDTIALYRDARDHVQDPS